MPKLGEDKVRLRELPTAEVYEAEAARFASYDPRAMQAYLTLISVSGHLQATMEERIVSHGLSKSRFVVLMLLRHSKDQLSTPAELAHRAAVTTATMTGLLDGLESKGLIRRTHREDDRRSLHIEITAKATALMGKLLPGHYQQLAQLMGALSHTEQTALTKLLVKMMPAKEGTASVVPIKRKARAATGS